MEALLLTAVGIAIGLGAAFALTRVMSSLLYGIDGTDSFTFVTTPLLPGMPRLPATFQLAGRETGPDDRAAV